MKNRGKRVFNFGAGPAMLPVSVLERVTEGLIDFRGLGAGVIEISHRSKPFMDLMDSVQHRFRALTQLPDDYEVLLMPGGARMQFAALAMNFARLKPQAKAKYVVSGSFSQHAATEASKYLHVETISGDPSFKSLPEVREEQIDPACSYVHLTSNNTVYGTTFSTFPATRGVPLVVDATSEILSRPMDFSRFGMIYAGLQKNLGPSGMAVVVVKKDLLGHALAETPSLLDYQRQAADGSLTNTINTFAVFVLDLMLEWLQGEGGVAAVYERNQQKAKLLYDYLDASTFYQPYCDPSCRSLMNVTFHLSDESATELFLAKAEQAGLYALKGYRSVGGIRASIYNPMPLEGVKALVAFMDDFAKNRATGAGVP